MNSSPATPQRCCVPWKYGPTLFAGLSKPLDLMLVNRLELSSGAVASQYVPR